MNLVIGTPEHPFQSRIAVDEVVLECRHGMQTGKDQQAPGQIFMNQAGDVLLLRNRGNQRWHLEPVEYRNRSSIGGGNQITGDHHREQADIEHAMP